jgi:lipopolysaccharide/colanic/teichoic acid biosynthesis glycosyltransferase
VPHINCEFSPPPDGRAAPLIVAGKYLAFKAVADRAVALILLLLAAPLISMLALLIRLTSRGPAFYSQLRLGHLGRPFRIWKLRTMIHDCEAATGPVWAAPNDRRVTSIGSILRNIYLDELPQLWNVIRGEMSLVGPRPERPEITERLESAVPGFHHRLLVKPGLTGLAQLRLRPDVDVGNVSHKLAQDLYYMRHQGLLLDLRILISTAFHLIGAVCACITSLLLGRNQSDPVARPELTWTIESLRRIPAAESEPKMPELDTDLQAAA